MTMTYNGREKQLIKVKIALLIKSSVKNTLPITEIFTEVRLLSNDMPMQTASERNIQTKPPIAKINLLSATVVLQNEYIAYAIKALMPAAIRVGINLTFIILMFLTIKQLNN